jgi:hypothetical protein
MSTVFRARRWLELVTRFPDLAEMRVLDLGGTASSWRLCPEKPHELTLLNPIAQSADEAHVFVGDACEPPAAILSERFDLIYSNSVIEHVGGRYRQQQFADMVHRLGKHHWVQTPNRYFPVEPHFLCPCFQYLPLRMATHVAIHWPVGHFAGKLDLQDMARATGSVLDIELLSGAHMRHYFPESTILRERVGLFTKSLIACA